MGWNRAMTHGRVAFAKYTKRTMANGIYEGEWPESASKLSINRYRHSKFLGKRKRSWKSNIFSLAY